MFFSSFAGGGSRTPRISARFPASTVTARSWGDSFNGEVDEREQEAAQDKREERTKEM